jgi:glycosyltransferase involved in cell wall biosynthesis
MLDVFAVERRHLRRTLQRESPDVVHAHWTYEYPLGALATTLPTLTTIRDWAPTILRNTPPWPYRLLRLMMALYVFWRGEHFTANSPYIASKMKSWFGWDIPVIPNALSDDQFYDSPRSPSLEAPVFVSVNNGFGPRKNVRTLLRAFQQLRDACSPACLKLIGTAYGRGEEAHAWATAHDLDDNVEFRGRVPHSTVIETILQADVLVHPAREESFGNTLVEAMAQKTPVIAGRNSGAVPWVLGEGDAGVLTDVEVPSTLAAAMKKMIESEDTWTTYAQAGFERARQNFRLTVTTDQFLSLYTQLANE